VIYQDDRIGCRPKSITNEANQVADRIRGSEEEDGTMKDRSLGKRLLNCFRCSLVLNREKWGERRRKAKWQQRNVCNNVPRGSAVLAVLWLMLLLISFCVTAPCRAGGGRTASQSVKPYPDVWYRSFEGKGEIFGLFFSARDVWGDEPVVVLLNTETGFGSAVGFFTGKYRNIRGICRQKVCGIYQGYRYYDTQTKREMVRRYTPPQDAHQVWIKTDDGGWLQSSEYATLTDGEIIDELFPEDVRKKIHDDFEKSMKDYPTRLIEGEITYAAIGHDRNCEPITSYLMKRDKHEKPVWAKSFVRFYPDRDRAPVQTLDRCVNYSNKAERIRVASSAGPILLLPDGTMLVGAPGAVVRIRQKNGGAPPSVLPETLRVFDAADVINAKLELMQQQAAVLKKCLEQGKRLKDSPECGLYRINKYGTEDDERIHLDLGKRLFSDK
jgi:hypothetical protein